MKRPGAITVSVVIVSMVIFFVILAVFLDTAGPIVSDTSTSELLLPVVGGAVILAPFVLDLIFLMLRRYWAHYLNLVIVGTLIGLFSLFAVFIAGRPDIYMGAVFIGVAVGLLVCLFIACLLVSCKRQHTYSRSAFRTLARISSELLAHTKRLPDSFQ